MSFKHHTRNSHASTYKKGIPQEEANVINQKIGLQMSTTTYM